MIHLFILLLMTGIVETVPTEEEMAEKFQTLYSGPRLQVDTGIVSGLSGQGFLTVAGPEGSEMVEPWLLIARQQWLLEALGWQAELHHSGTMSMKVFQNALHASGKSGWPALWVFSGSDGTVTIGTADDVPPDVAGCFGGVFARGVTEPVSEKALIKRSLLETVSYAHSATASGLSGLESFHDPYIAQGFGAYKRIFADLQTESPRRIEAIKKRIDRWIFRREVSVQYLNWASERLGEEAMSVPQAAVYLSNEVSQSLKPLRDNLAAEPPTPGNRKKWGKQVMQALAWHIKAIQMIESVAFAYADLSPDEADLLHAPDEEPVKETDVAGLLNLVQHTYTPVRRIALRKLAGAPLSNGDITVIEGALSDPDPLVAEAALMVLEAERPFDLRQRLERVIFDTTHVRLHGDGTFLRCLTLAMTRVREAEVPGILVRIASEYQPWDCRFRSIPFWCAEGVVSLLGQGSWPYLEQMLDANSPYVREAAAISLGNIGVNEVAERLRIVAQNDTDDLVRCAALGSLGRLGDTASFAQLIGYLDHGEVAVRSAAAASLVEGGEPALDAISSTRSELTRRQKEAAISVLTQIRNGRACSLLILFADDSDLLVRDMAKSALENCP